MRVAEAIELDAQTERELRTLSKGRRVEARVQQRASVILLAAQGWQNKDIAEAVKLDRRQVAVWRRRFIEGGLQVLLQDAARSGRTPSVTLAVESLIVSRTLHEQPPEATHWSSRTLASHLGLSATTIRRVWQRHGIQPHMQDGVKGSEDRRFEDRLIDVVGLYMHPPERALVLGGDDEGQRQALNRRKAGAPKQSGRASTPALLAALDTLNGARTALPQGTHRHEAWLRFLRQIDRKTPPHLQLHLIVESGSTHRHPEVQAWVARHPRFVMHFTPASASWLNMIGWFFAGTPENRIRCEGFSRVAELQQAMVQHIAQGHQLPGPFIWTASAPGQAHGIRARNGLERARR
jgi:transposase